MGILTPNSSITRLVKGSEKIQFIVFRKIREKLERTIIIFIPSLNLISKIFLIALFPI